jgi:hypothetical protein
MSDEDGRDSNSLGRGLNAGHLVTGFVLLAMVLFVLMWLL